MNTNELHDLAKKIAPLIGYEYPTERGWPGNFDNDGKLRDRFARLVRKENGETVGAITIDPVEYGHSKGRIAIAVAWPNSGSEHGYRTYNLLSYELYRLGGGDKKTSISVSGDKTPEQIAKDIKSRLLADAEWLYQQAKLKMERELNYEASKKAAVDAVAALTGNSVSKRDYENTPYYHPHKNYNIKVTVISGDSFKVEFDVDSVAKVKRLLDIGVQHDIEEVVAAALRG